jgi:hypothetical protein
MFWIYDVNTYLYCINILEQWKHSVETIKMYCENNENILMEKNKNILLEQWKCSVEQSNFAGRTIEFYYCNIWFIKMEHLKLKIKI